MCVHARRSIRLSGTATRSTAASGLLADTSNWWRLGVVRGGSAGLRSLPADYRQLAHGGDGNRGRGVP
jgi:hypothetical protein